MAHRQPPKHDPLIGVQACIVWHNAERAPSSDLLRALANKGMTLIDADNPHTAFAAATHASRNAARSILVLDTHESLPDADRVITALQRFAPGVLCWAHRPGANPPLLPLVQHKSPPAGSDNPAPAPAPAPAKHPDHTPASLRLVGQPDSTRAQDTEPEPTPMSQSQPAVKPKALNTRDVLDADELNALLAGELGDRKN